MSAGPPADGDGEDPGFVDPFSTEDPAAAERERRRQEREAKRAAQGKRSAQTMRSLAERVGAAADPPAERPVQSPPQGPARTSDRPAAASPPPGPPASSEPGGHEPRPPRRGPAQTHRLIAAGALLLLAVGFIAVAAGALDGSDPPPPAKAPKAVKTISVTVPEGMTIEQTAKIAKQAGLTGSYEKAAKKALAKFKPRRYGAAQAGSLEGFLFPATYELEKGAPAADLVGKQLEAFDENFGTVDIRRAERKNLTAYDVVTIASMIEREVSVAKERPLVAAVIYNRLAAGEPLGIDATLRYELGNYDKPLLESELEADTPYNTRTRAGLPPSPIAGPGIDSLKAAADPADVDFRFYVIKPGTCNEHFFTARGDEFDAAVADYQEALAAKGGSPTDCG